MPISAEAPERGSGTAAETLKRCRRGEGGIGDTL